MELQDAKFSLDYDGSDFTIPLGQYELLGQSWVPENPRFIYVFIHGLGCYVTFKRDIFDIFKDMGGAVYACDHYGHGRSPGVRTSCTIDECIEETRKVVQLAQERHPGLPVILHGHSMGGLIAISLVYDNPAWAIENIRGIIAESPWISQCPQHRIGSLLRFGIRCISWSSMLITSGVDAFSPDLDKTWVEMTKGSPLYTYDVTPRLINSQMNWSDLIQSSPDKWPAELPLLFIQGMQDPLVDAKESEHFIVPLSQREGVKVTYDKYEDGSHVMLKSTHRGQILRGMVAFIRRECNLEN